MRLLTHNFLKSNVNGTEKGYPLRIEATKIEYENTYETPDMILKMMPKLNYDALRNAVNQINDAISNSTADCTCLSTDDKEEVTIPDLPATLPSDDKEATDYRQLEEGVLEELHKVVFDLHVMSGYLLCPDTSRKFPVSDGIPNMILHEDEI
mmetsp:Transcript_55017/g.64362  ORF Transcript_55017/g.64362 Transcript_55017/m.64362 type:complete len:152 (+) Transcript_55017:134-589(+)